MNWTFASVTLVVLDDPPPSWLDGRRWIAFEPDGFDGVSAFADDGQLPVSVALTVLAEGAAQLASLVALFRGVVEGDLEMPVGNDAWVYEDCRVRGPVRWVEALFAGAWQARIEVLCPTPRPKWKSTGVYVF